MGTGRIVADTLRKASTNRALAAREVERQLGNSFARGMARYDNNRKRSEAHIRERTKDQRHARTLAHLFGVLTPREKVLRTLKTRPETHYEQIQRAKHITPFTSTIGTNSTYYNHGSKTVSKSTKGTLRSNGTNSDNNRDNNSDNNPWKSNNKEPRKEGKGSTYFTTKKDFYDDTKAPAKVVRERLRRDTERVTQAAQASGWGKISIMQSLSKARRGPASMQVLEMIVANNTVDRLEPKDFHRVVMALSMRPTDNISLMRRCYSLWTESGKPFVLLSLSTLVESAYEADDLRLALSAFTDINEHFLLDTYPRHSVGHILSLFARQPSAAARGQGLVFLQGLLDERPCKLTHDTSWHDQGRTLLRALDMEDNCPDYRIPTIHKNYTQIIPKN